MPKCNRCGAEVRYLRTDKDNRTTVDPTPVDYWNRGQGYSMLIDSRGHIIDCDLEGEGMPEGCGYVPHFKTCVKGRGRRK